MRLILCSAVRSLNRRGQMDLKVISFFLDLRDNLEFWNETGDLLDAARRFTVSDSIYKYAEKMISTKFEDCKHGCWECFDGYLFSLAYGLNVLQKYVSFFFQFDSYDFISEKV